MAGSVLSVAVVACTAVLAVGLTTAGAGAVFSQRIAGVADAAALAAADAASGAVSGDPCDRAIEVASASGADVVACDLEGLVATVTVSAEFGRLAATVSARAGPSPDDAAHSARLSSFTRQQAGGLGPSPSRRCVWCASKKGRPRWQQARSSSSSSHRRR